MGRTGMIVGGLAVAAALVAGGSAFTDANSSPASQTVGYSTTSVSGATIDSITYTLSSDGSTVDDVNLTLAGDTTTSAVSVALNSGDALSCGTGTVTGTSPDQTTAYSCDVSSLAMATSALTATHVVVN